MLRGIDISEHQGLINIKALKNQIDFIILRVGYTGYGKSKTKNKDKHFERNYKLCKELGIPVGAYYYSCATTKAEAKEEAELVLKWIEGKQFEYPIYFDTEDNHDTNKYAPKSQLSIGKEKLTEVAITFLETIESKGYYVGLYASTSWLNNQLIMNKLKMYDVWVAHYDVQKPSYKGNYGMWQYTSKGKLNGYAGNLDMNYAYQEYPEVIKMGKLNGFNTRKPISEVAKEVQKVLNDSGYAFEEIEGLLNG